MEFRGTQAAPVRFVVLRGLTFRHAARTVMDTREPLLRTDWAIYRGGALFFQGTEDCALEDSFLDQVGGNAVFVNHYNRRLTIRGCHIAKAGASGICFVGDPQAARSPLFHYAQVHNLKDLDRTPGPRTQNYPADCVVDDCLIHLTGRVEKQTAGVSIDLAQGITVRHCSIYDTPRAGINIGDGCWGGHVVEFCDVFDTVKETGDHGSFNSWGRDRFWCPDIQEVNSRVKQYPDLPRLDTVNPIVLRNNRWRCDHGWDIDLDDGSSFYIITNNLCLRGGIKNREGYGRNVQNNVIVNSSLHPHVWYANSGDIFRRNIIWCPYQPALMPAPPWGLELDYNLVHLEFAQKTPATRLQKQSGRDEHSIVADAQFIDPAAGDYRVANSSPALELGFVNFSMDDFGVQKPSLRALARQPVLPGAKPAFTSGGRDTAARFWLGAKVRNVADTGEMSSLGLPAVTGVLVLEVPTESALAKSGLQKGDVILSVAGAETGDVTALLRNAPALAAYQTISLSVSRQQKEMPLQIKQ